MSSMMIPPTTIHGSLGTCAKYRFAPYYTNVHVGFETMFKPTGGVLCFRVQKPIDDMRRLILNQDYKDVLTLGEIAAILSNDKTKAVTQMYRPTLVDNEIDDEITADRIATFISPYGVTSLSQFDDWHKDAMINTQPVLIYGACKDGVAKYETHDTLRLPADSCIMEEQNMNKCQFGYVFVTMFRDDTATAEWRMKFIITTKSSYINKVMMRAEGYSLVYRVGIIDYVRDLNVPNPYLYKSPGSDFHDLYIEGFVFEPRGGRWRLQYDTEMKDFINKNQKNWQTLLEFDASKRAIINHFFRLYQLQKEKSNDSSSSSDWSTSDSSDEGGSVFMKTQQRKQKKRADSAARIIDGNLVRRRCRSTSSSEDSSSSNSTKTRPRVGGKGRVLGGEHQQRSYPTISYTRSTAFPKPASCPIKVTMSPSRGASTSTATMNMLKRALSLIPNRNNGDLMALAAKVTRMPSVQLPYLGLDFLGTTITCEDAYRVITMALFQRLDIRVIHSGTQTHDRETEDHVTKQMSFAAMYTRKEVNKIACFLDYALRCTNEPRLIRNRNLTFVQKPIITSFDVTTPLTPKFDATSGGRIEDLPNTTHVDFANRRFGGGVLGSGSLQEEIMIMMKPELLVGRAMFPPTSNAHANVIMGAIQFNDHSGYAKTFVYRPLRRMSTPSHLDIKGRAMTEVVAIDAIDFKKNRLDQYDKSNVDRDLIKAYVGFEPLPGTDPNVPIVSGKWGAGDFGGDAALKSLIQFAAASMARRPLRLRMMGSPLADNLNSARDLCVDLGLTVGDLIHLLCDVVATGSTKDTAGEKTTMSIVLKKLHKLKQQHPPVSQHPLYQSPQAQQHPMPTYINDMTGQGISGSVEQLNSVGSASESSDYYVNQLGDLTASMGGDSVNPHPPPNPQPTRTRSRSRSPLAEAVSLLASVPPPPRSNRGKTRAKTSQQKTPTSRVQGPTPVMYPPGFDPSSPPLQPSFLPTGSDATTTLPSSQPASPT